MDILPLLLYLPLRPLRSLLPLPDDPVDLLPGLPHPILMRTLTVVVPALRLPKLLPEKLPGRVSPGAKWLLLDE